MAKIEIEIDDEIETKINSFCNESGFSKQDLFNLFAKKVASEQKIPFDVKTKNTKSKIIENCDLEKLSWIIINLDYTSQAVLLSLISVENASKILAKFPKELQSKIIQLIANGIDLKNITINEIIKKVEDEIVSGKEVDCLGGISDIIDLSYFNYSSIKSYLEYLKEKNDTDLSDELNKRIFSFEDIDCLDDRAVQKFLCEIDQGELAKALKNVDSGVQEKIFKNLSKRSADMLKEEMKYMGPVCLEDIEEIQGRIVNIILRLENAGEIVIFRPSYFDL